MIAAFQYYFPNVIDGINQKHLNSNDQEIKIKKVQQPVQVSLEIKEDVDPSVQQDNTKNEIEMLIEDKFLGKIIGKGGYMIDEIRTTSKAKISIFRKLYDTKRLIVISGKNICIQKAKNTILELCC